MTDPGMSAINQIGAIVAARRPRNVLDLQAEAAQRAIENDLRILTKQDPHFYYKGEFDALLDRWLALAKRMESGPIS